jgi:hypothetical protein
MPSTVTVAGRYFDSDESDDASESVKRAAEGAEQESSRQRRMRSRSTGSVTAMGSSMAHSTARDSDTRSQVSGAPLRSPPTEPKEPLQKVPELSALSKQFLSDLAATHHRADFMDKREAQRSYTASLREKLNREEEEQDAADDGPEALQEFMTLRESQSSRIAGRPETPLTTAQREAERDKLAVNGRLRALGYAVDDVTRASLQARIAAIPVDGDDRVALTV